MGVSILISVETWFLWCLGFDCNASIQPPSWRFFVWCFRSATRQFAEVFSSCTSMVTDDQYKRLHVWKIAVAQHVNMLRCSNGLGACLLVRKSYLFFFGQRTAFFWHSGHMWTQRCFCDRRMGFWNGIDGNFGEMIQFEEHIFVQNLSC